MNEQISRRKLLKHGAAAIASAALVSGCMQPVGVTLTNNHPADAPSDPDSPDKVVLGLFPRDGQSSPQMAVRNACRQLDWSWLRRGDSVFVKLSSNSAHPHPAATSPNAVRAIVTELLDRGAGRVLVGDQGGVEYVRLVDGDKRHGSTETLMRKNGLHEAIVDSGARPCFFDDYGYETGYFQASLPFDNPHWREPPYVARIIREVDHIIYLPRLASHVLAGYTHGHKIAVGWLRDDSRFQMHFEAGSFHEKYVEVNYIPDIRQRLRLVITLAEQVLLNVGPDVGTLATPDSWIVIASSHLANHDAVSVAVLAYVDGKTANGVHFIPPAYGTLSNTANWTFLSQIVPAQTGIPWGKPRMLTYQKLRTHRYQTGIASDLALTRAYQILGGVPRTIAVHTTGRAPDAEFRSFLRAYLSGVAGRSG
ncbi:MAG TPA: DUF362 domain-containing protein [Phycisphaerae bacterium]|nr:DUF362 domain-containing protein [Phycisphaerae bacterium]HRR85885.1 DUF362 domain-containing protein [Phycisphaerae bacterium]